MIANPIDLALLALLVVAVGRILWLAVPSDPEPRTLYGWRPSMDAEGRPVEDRDA